MQKVWPVYLLESLSDADGSGWIRGLIQCWWSVISLFRLRLQIFWVSDLDPTPDIKHVLLLFKKFKKAGGLSSTSWKPRFDSRRLHKPLGLVAQFCNPATGEQGYFYGAGHLGLLTWLGLDLSDSLQGLETQAESDHCKRSGSWPWGTVALNKGGVISGL